MESKSDQKNTFKRQRNISVFMLFFLLIYWIVFCQFNLYPILASCIQVLKYEVVAINESTNNHVTEGPK